MLKRMRLSFYNALFMFYVKMGVFYNREAETNLENANRCEEKAKEMYKQLRKHISN